MSFEEKMLETKHIFKGKVIDLDVETVLLPMGIRLQERLSGIMER